MAEKKDIWKMLEEYDAKYGSGEESAPGEETPAPQKKKRRRRKIKPTGGLLQRAMGTMQNRTKNIDNAVNRALGKKGRRK